MDESRELYDKLVCVLKEAYGDYLVSIILYGSFARGTNTEESDIDIAILINGEPTKTMCEMATDRIVDLELEYNKVLSVLRLDKDIFKKWENVLPFYKNVRNEGVVLWTAA